MNLSFVIGILFIIIVVFVSDSAFGERLGPGLVCSDDSQCKSGICGKGRCCNSDDSTGLSKGCISCNSKGECNECMASCEGLPYPCPYGFDLINGGCVAINGNRVNGAECSQDLDCNSQVCRGGRCCNVAKGSTEGCLSCDGQIGDCRACNETAGFILDNFMCYKNIGETCIAGESLCVFGACKGGMCCRSRLDSPGIQFCSRCSPDSGVCLKCKKQYKLTGKGGCKKMRKVSG